MHILIAGGAGFVGANLAVYFKQAYPHYKISCFDNLSRKGSALNLPRLEAAGVGFRKADTRYPNELADFDKVDVIIDAAAEPSVLAGLQGGLDYLVQTNFNGTVNLLNLAKEHAAGFIFLSTSRVYPIATLGALPMVPDGNRFKLHQNYAAIGCTQAGIAENFSLTGSRSLYGATKLASELMVEEYRAAFGLETVINRCGVIAGPWQMGKVDQGVAALWMAYHYWNRPLQYIGYGGMGLQVRDLLHIHDLFRLIDYQVHHLTALNGETFNVGGGMACSVSLAELTELCVAITGNKPLIQASATDRPGDIPWYITNNQKVTESTCWKPKMSTAQLMQDIFDWIQRHENELKNIFIE